MYIELHTASAFSFLAGASLPETLVARAAALGYPAIALLDRDGVYGAPQLYRAAKAAGLRAIVGAELTITQTHPGGSSLWTLPVLVASVEGYRNLCRLITRAKSKAAKGESLLTLADLDGHCGGLIALAGRPALVAERHGVGGLVDQIVGIFGRDRVWVELQRHLRRDEEEANASLLDLAAAFRVPVMASNGVRFASPEDRPVFDVLTCLRHKTTLAQAGRRLSVNAERYLKPPEMMARLFSDLPQALAGTESLAERLEFTLVNLGYRFPEYPVPAGETQASFLRRLTYVGARDRYHPLDEAFGGRAKAQIQRELDLIDKLNLAGYFLIVWDLVNFCRQQGILVQGRGSAANSAVCYSLGITAVDPVGMELLFERFLSEERGEWPDIDLDLPSGDRRERVIQYVYQRYGAAGAAMTANVISYRGRSAAREVGKVLSMDEGEINVLSKMMSRFEFVDPADTVTQHLKEAGVDTGKQIYTQFATLWQRMQDLPRHLGQHSGGMVMCQGRLDEVVPLEPASMPGRMVVQWDKDDCSDLGIVKVDLLGLGMMAVLEEAVLLTGVDLAHLPPDDPEVYRMLQAADTVGVFQVESRAQMATLPRLKPKHFYDIVVEVALIRPGPIVGQMVHPYLKRRRGDEPVTYAHPSLEPVLKRTLGVPLFQEQLLRIAMVIANFSGGEAEELRRAMGFKRSAKRMLDIEGRLRAGMARNGITGAVADQIVLSISSFALYGFPESHAASFALIVYASAYLKVHFPTAFYTALLNNQPMGFYAPATLVKDAQRRGVRFAPVDVQASDWPCTIQDDGVIRLGLMYVQGLREEAGRKIAATKTTSEVVSTSGYMKRPQRSFSCRFRTLDELGGRTGLRRDELRMLAESGALASLGGDRRSALWQAERAARPAGPLLCDSFDSPDTGSLKEKTSGVFFPAALKKTPDVFSGSEPEIRSPLPAMSLLERVEADYHTTGLTIGPHPMALVRRTLSARGVVRAVDLAHGRPGRRVRVAGAVITRQRPGTAKGFVFLSLEDETGIANAILTPDVFTSHKRTVVDAPYLLIEGVLQNQDGAISVKAERVEALAHQGPPPQSHDFR
ncbi:MAG TPA: error-prone DNA polymerase [Vicinamibacterales bacterium]|jgi:error-prone DNA polymerase|nr:error-prone DNA polymerase [Vicinamibacterales bacterium]